MIDVLITRPNNDRASQLADQLCDKGLNAEISSVFSYIPGADIISKTTLPAANDLDFVIITSAQALTFIEQNQCAALSDKPLYCVGKTSAEAARDYGFTGDIVTASTAKDLSLIIKERIQKGRSGLYIRGQSISFSFQEFCHDHGIALQDYISYDTKAIDALPSDIIKALTGKSLKSVAFYSKRTAEIFMNLIDQHNLTRTLNDVYALCIADSVIKCPKMNTDIWKDVYVSKTPDQDGMITLCKDVL